MVLYWWVVRTVVGRRKRRCSGLCSMVMVVVEARRCFCCGYCARFAVGGETIPTRTIGVGSRNGRHVVTVVTATKQRWSCFICSVETTTTTDTKGTIILSSPLLLSSWWSQLSQNNFPMFKLLQSFCITTSFATQTTTERTR
jgi:hypothetical protein